MGLSSLPNCGRASETADAGARAGSYPTLSALLFGLVADCNISVTDIPLTDRVRWL